MMEEQAALLQRHIVLLKSGDSPHIAEVNVAETGKKVKKAKKEPVDPNKPKKSPSAYLLYMGENQAPFKAANPTLSQIEVMTALGNRWTALPLEARDRFMKQANIHKELYEMKMAVYASGSSSSSAQSMVLSPAAKGVAAIPNPIVAAPKPVVVAAPIVPESERELKKKKKRAQKEAEAAVVALAPIESLSAPESEKKEVRVRTLFPP